MPRVRFATSSARPDAFYRLRDRFAASRLTLVPEGPRYAICRRSVVLAEVCSLQGAADWLRARQRDRPPPRRRPPAVQSPRRLQQ